MENGAYPSRKCSTMAEKDKQGNGVGQMGQRKGVQHRKEIKLVIQKAQSV